MSEVITHPFLSSEFEICWSRLAVDRVVEDISKAIELAQEKIDCLAAREPVGLTYENTLLALESATEVLEEAWGKVNHLDSTMNSKELRAAYNEMLPRVTEFHAKIPLNSELWAVLKAYSETDEAKSLSGVKKRFLEETLANFRDHGADLPDDKKLELENVSRELAQTTQKYSENVLDSTNAWELVVKDESRLAGLPPSALKAAQQSAEKAGHGDEENPQWRFTLHMPSLLPVLRYAEDESLRKEVFIAMNAIGSTAPHDNSSLIWKILKLRQEKAEILGKDHFADVVLERRMASTGKSALNFVEDLHRKTLPFFKKENDALESFVAKKTGQPKEPVELWNQAYWAEKLRLEEYSFDEEVLRPYFPIDSVIKGLFQIAGKLFDVIIEERPATLKKSSPEEVEVWHPEVKYYEIRDGRDGRHLGSFYADWHPRPSKRSGAWMNYFKTGEVAGNGKSRGPHLGLICGNLTAPLKDQPALLLHDEVLTVFHEFGHLIHHLLGDVPVKSLNGIHVYWDFVELPSQIMENWCWEREGLDLFARHHETGERIPDELFDKLIASRNFFSARGMMRQLSFGKMDLELHMNYHDASNLNLDELIRGLLKDYQPPAKTRFLSNVRRFGHLFASSTGYAAGYYSYKWAEVLDADAFTRFKEEGIMNVETGKSLRQEILSQGNSQHPAKLFRNFMGRDPDQNALLERCGLC